MSNILKDKDDIRMFNSYPVHEDRNLELAEKELRAFKVHLAQFDGYVFLPTKFIGRPKLNFTIYVPTIEIKHVIGSGGSNLAKVKCSIASITKTSFDNIYIKVKPQTRNVNEFNIYGIYYYSESYLRKNDKIYAKVINARGDTFFMNDIGLYKTNMFSDKDLILTYDDICEEIDLIDKWFNGAEVYFKDTDKALMVEI